MTFYVYHIKSPVLKPYVQYILFNICEDANYKGVIRSFANTNYCLGIVKDKQLCKDKEGNVFMKEKVGINSYLSGIYLEPYNFLANGQLDEICIDFTPLGYYHFFNTPAKTLITDDDLIRETFGKESLNFFTEIFEEKNMLRRGELIEFFLNLKFHSFSATLLFEAITLIEKKKGCISISAMAQELNCSEKKIFRLFEHYLDLSPKEYIRVCRFRYALRLLTDTRKDFASQAYELGFADQSHMTREIKFFTGTTPKLLSRDVRTINESVFTMVMQNS